MTRATETLGASHPRKSTPSPQGPISPSPRGLPPHLTLPYLPLPRGGSSPPRVTLSLRGPRRLTSHDPDTSWLKLERASGALTCTRTGGAKAGLRESSAPPPANSALTSGASPKGDVSAPREAVTESSSLVHLKGAAALTVRSGRWPKALH